MRVLLLSMPRHIAGLIKQESPGTLVARGSYHATTMHRELADSPEAEVLDFIYRGEADHGFGELLDALEGRRSMASVAGLSWKRRGAFVHNADRPLEDLSAIALPDRDRRVYEFYHYYFQKDVMETSRGCLHRCNFCSMNQMYGPTFRRYTVDRVLEDVRDVHRRRGRRRVGHVLRASTTFSGTWRSTSDSSIPLVEGPDGIGNPAASLDFGQAPYKDTNDEPSFVRTVAGIHS